MRDGHCADPSLPLHLDQGRGSSKKESFSLRVSPALHPPERPSPRRVDMAGHGHGSGDAGTEDILFMTQLPSLERWALLPFLGFSYPNLLLVFLNLFFLGTGIICFSQVLDFLWVFFILFYFSVPYFGLACDHGNSFLCLEE